MSSQQFASICFGMKFRTLVHLLVQRRAFPGVGTRRGVCVTDASI